MLPFIDPRWYDVEQLSDLQKMMKLFLTGQLQASPWHYGPLEEETSPLVPSLIALNAVGIIPTNSQPGIQERFRIFRQRSYLEALVTPSQLPKFEHLCELGYEVGVTSHHAADSAGTYRMPVTQYRFRSCTFSPGSHPPVPVTSVFDEGRLSESAEKLYYDLSTVFVTEREWGSNNLWIDLMKVSAQ